jgi:hypothetical protein
VHNISMWCQYHGHNKVKSFSNLHELIDGSLRNILE